MARLIQFADLLPSILCNIIDLAFLCGIIWILRTYGKEIVLCLIIHAFVQMSQLMTRATILHVCAALNIISSFVNNQAVSCHDCPNVIFFFLTSDAEYFVLNLD